jgi:hypothetical protein
LRAGKNEWDEAIIAPCPRPQCKAPAGRRCVNDWGTANRPHQRRVKLAYAIRAHADPALDALWPHHGPCLLCGVEGLGARHRVIDAIAGWLAAVDDPADAVDELAGEYNRSPEAVKAVIAWMEKWPGAWR